MEALPGFILAYSKYEPWGGGGSIVTQGRATTLAVPQLLQVRQQLLLPPIQLDGQHVEMIHHLLPGKAVLLSPTPGGGSCIPPLGLTPFPQMATPRKAGVSFAALRDDRLAGAQRPRGVHCGG